MSTKSVQRVIVDLDVGTDDAFALFLLLFAEEIGKIKIEAIVCTMGNSYLEHVCKNVIRLLEILGRTDIPVFKGASEPIKPLPKELPHNFFFHGKDGFGDVQFETDPNISIINEMPASVAVNEIITKYPGEVTLVCTGPLTNAALTIMNFEQFAQNLKGIFVFGGNHKGKGNITDYAEFNFFVDPLGANIVLTNGIVPVTLVTWETSLDTSINMEWRYKTLGILQSPFMELLNKVEESVYKDVLLDELWVAPDVFLVVAMLYPESIIDSVKGTALVDFQSQQSRGKVVFTQLEKQQINVITKIDVEFVKKILLQAATFYNIINEYHK